MVKMMLDKGYTLDYVMGLDVYGWMVHLGCALYDADSGKEVGDDG